MLLEHLEYLSDSVRLGLFRDAVRAAVKPGDRIADLGCGTGILGLLCLQAGAGHVYAIDESAMLAVARETLTRAGFGDRATFIRGRCQQVELPERVDVAICDHVGYFGFDYGIVDLFRDAQRRFLKPGGALIPHRIRLQVAAVESEKCRGLAEGWRAEGVPPELGWMQDHAFNAKYSVSLERRDLLGAPSELGTLDLGGAGAEFHSWTAELHIERDGFVHGLGGWFDCELHEGVRMTNSPLAEASVQRPQAFLPIGESTPVKSGDAVNATLMVRPADNLVRWMVEFPSTGRRFDHSTWQGILLTPEDLHRANPARVPRPGRHARARAIVLGYCDGMRSAGEIAELVAREHPGLFPSDLEIARFVAHTLQRDAD